MSYQDDRQYQLDAEIQHLTNLKRQLRAREKDLQARAKYLPQPTQYAQNSIRDLKRQLQGSLSQGLMPSNIGGLNEVAIPFWFQANVDFGIDPDISYNNRIRSYFQVDQEMSFIMMSVAIAFFDGAGMSGSACELAPLQVEFIDRQSTRRFMSEAIPLQTLGQNSNPTAFPTPMFMQPNAFLDVEVYGINQTPQSFSGSGLINFSFFGYRVRTEDAGKILSTIFG